jgi:hypothetical protein
MDFWAAQLIFSYMIILSLIFTVTQVLAHPLEDDLESAQMILGRLPCVKASRSQLAMVNRGNSKKDLFLSRCATATAGSTWCDQLIRPNPDSLEIFHCTYGKAQAHQLIHPDESTWKNAFDAILLVEELQKSGVQVCEIYNWWRPEPYNKNVGGAPGRHPFGTSVDVLLCSKEEQEKAFLKMCELRKAGKLRALGYYPTPALHFGVGDSRPNTWGKSCPP